ncbi:MAG: sugar phosphate isomerase/epimerase [Phycisphaeraceae bacterium]|nr:sugar phosphate isomerase/epimerase [Phycisphaeraceae bacterium]
MAEPRQTQSSVLSRRHFCQSVLTASAALHWAKISALASEATREVKFYKNLGCGHLGVKADQTQALAYARQYGFDAITPDAGAFQNKSASEIRNWVQTMKDQNIRFGTSGLPVEFRRDEERFQNDLKRLPKQAETLSQLGVTRMATWILPGTNTLTYQQNFSQHQRRLRQVALVLKDHDIRLGLEFVGPRTSRARNRFPFVCTQQGMMELVKAIDTGNVGLLLDSWHWYTSHGSVEELLQLSNRDIVHVHVNDAPAGVPVDQQVDNKRQLPVTTGVIDMKGFVNALVAIGYDGPIECEPFDQGLRNMEDAAAVQKTIESLNRLWGLIAP